MEFDKNNFAKIVELETSPENLERGRQIWLDCEKNNDNNFSNWYPYLASKMDCSEIELPFSIYFQMPDELLGTTLCEHPGDYEKFMEWFRPIAEKMKEFFPYGCFIKNGTFSNKFDFNHSCRVEAAQMTPEGLFKHFSNIEMFALTFETYGDLEIVFREWIPANSPYGYIYNGLPLRPEIRTFFNFNDKKAIYSVNYWDWDYCSKNLSGDDYYNLENCKHLLESAFFILEREVEQKLEKALANVELDGFWSVDTMFEDGKYYLIDMARAENSAYFDATKLNKQ